MHVEADVTHNGPARVRTQTCVLNVQHCDEPQWCNRATHRRGIPFRGKRRHGNFPEPVRIPMPSATTIFIPLTANETRSQRRFRAIKICPRAAAWHRSRLSHVSAAARAQSLSFKRLGAHACAQAPAPQAEHGAPSRLCESMAPLRSFLPPEQTAIRTGGNKLRRCS